jgi:Secretion system C-terminal sorting domain
MKKFILFIIFCISFGVSKAQVIWFAPEGPTTEVSDLQVCGDTTFSAYIFNNTSGVLGSCTLTVALPANVVYIAGSVVETTNGSPLKTVLQGNISNLSAPKFVFNNIPIGQKVSFTYRVHSTCGSVQSSVAPILTLNYNVVSNASPTPAPTFAIKKAKLNIVALSNVNFTSSVGNTYVQSATIRNAGLGYLDGSKPGTFIKVLLDSTTCLTMSNPSIGTIVKDTLIIPNTSILGIGDGDFFWENNEDMQVSFTVNILCCTNLTRSIKALYGCDASICDTSSSYPTNTIISNTNPLVSVYMPVLNYSAFQFTGELYYHRLMLVNTGSGIAKDMTLDLRNYWVGSFTGYNYYDTTKVWNVKNSANVNIGVCNSFTNVGMTGTYDSSCAYRVYMGYGIGKLPGIVMQPNDTMYIDIPVVTYNFRCIPNWCPQGIGWLGIATQLNYKNQCGTAYQDALRLHIARNYSYFQSVITMPSDVNGYAPLNTFDFDVYHSIGYTVTNPNNTGIHRFVLPLTGTGMTCSLTSLTFSSSYGNITVPVSNVNDTVRFDFPPNLYLTAVNYKIPLTVLCGTPGNKTLNPYILCSFDSTTNVFFKLTCETKTIKVHCNAACPRGGATPMNFTLRRINYGLPDNNEDHIPDVGGTIDLSKIFNQNAVTGDTIQGVWNIKMFVNDDITDGNYGLPHPYSFVEFDLKPFAFDGYLTGNTRMFTALPAAQLTVYPAGGGAPIVCTVNPTIANNRAKYNLNGCYSPWNPGDSMVLKAKYRVLYSYYGGWLVTEHLVSNNQVYSSYVPNPTGPLIGGSGPSSKYTCDDYDDYIDVFQIWHSPWMYNQPINGCDANDIYIYHRQYMRNQEGANMFKYEFRNFFIPDVHKVLVAPGFKYRPGTAFVADDMNGWVAIAASDIVQIGDTISFINGRLRYSENGGTWQSQDEISQSYIRFQLDAPCNTPTGSYPGTNWSIGKGNGINTPANNFMSFTNRYGFPSQYLYGAPAGYPGIYIYTAPDIITSGGTTIAAGSDTATWSIIKQNASNSVSAPNSWFHISNLSGTPLTNIQLKNASTNAIITPDANGFYSLGTVGPNSSFSYKIIGLKVACDTTKLLLRSGWKCGAFPTNITDPANSCSPPIELKVYSFPSGTDASVDVNWTAPNSKINFCSPFNVDFTMNTTQLGDLENLVSDWVVPNGFTSNLSGLKIEYPLGTGFRTPSNLAAATLTGSVIHIDVDMLDALLNNGITGSYNLTKKVVKIRIPFNTTCGAFSGDKIDITYNSKSYCGQIMPTIVENTPPLNIAQAVAATYAAYPFGNTDTIKTCDNTTVRDFNLTIPIASAPGSSSPSDSIFIELPPGVTYFSYNPSAAGQVNQPTVVPNGPFALSAGKTKIEFPMTGGLNSGDSIKLTIKFKFNYANYIAYQGNYKSFDITTGGNTPLVCNSVTCNIVSSSGNGSFEFPILLPKAKIDVSSNPICANTPTTLTGSGMSNYLWKPSNINSNPYTINNLASTTTFTLIGTDASGCVDSTTSLISVNPTPPISISASFGAICPNEVRVLTALGGFNYTWLHDGSTNPIVNVNPSVTTTYTVVGLDGNLCSASSTITVVVNPVPVVSASVTTNSICLNASTTINASGAVSYAWSNNVSTVSQTVSPIITTIYTVTGTSALGCTATSSVTVTVAPLPNLALSNYATAVCVGTCVSITASGASTYNWMPGNTTAAVRSLCPTAYTIYTVTGTGSNGCTSTTEVSVGINALPTVSPLNLTICLGDTADVGVIESGGTSIIWNPTGNTTNPFTVTPIATTSYTATVTTTNGCTKTTVTTITVNPLPIIGSNNPTICIGLPATLSGTGGINYLWSGGVVNGQVFYPTTTGNYTVTGSNATTGCIKTYVATVTVNPTPTVSIASSPGTTFCVGQNVTLTASGTNTYSWTGGVSNGVPFSPPTGTTGYTVTGTNSFGCSTTSSISITENPLATPALTANPNPICVGQTTTLTASGAASYTWSAPFNGSATTQTVTPVVGTTVYTVTGYTSNGCASTATVALVVNPLPAPVLTANPSTICLGQSSTITATGSALYLWEAPLLGNATTQVVSPSVGTSTYTITGTTSSGCESTATVSITVNPLATPTLTASPNPICLGQTSILTASGANSYTWSAPLSGSATTQSVSPAVGTTTYTVTGATSNGCTSTVTVSLVVNPLATPTLTASPNPICLGQSSTLTASGASSYTWSSPLAGNASTQIVSPAVGTTIYTVTGATINGCTSTTTVSLVVNPLATPTLTASPNPICFGETSTLTASGAYSYIWSSPLLGTASTQSVSPAVGATIYTVTGVTSNGCSSTATVSLVVNPLATPTLTASPNPICLGQTSILTASGANSYTWSAPLSGVATTQSVSPAVGTTTYTVTGATSNGCTSTATVSLVVNPLPLITLSSNPNPVCEGLDYTLTATGGDTYIWSGGLLGTANTQVITAINSSSYTVTGTTSGTGCTSSSSVNVTVNPAITVTAVASASTLCAGESATLTFAGATTYSVDAVSIAGNSLIVSPIVGTNTYTITGASGVGCSATTVISIVVNPRPTIGLSASASDVCAGQPVVFTVSGASTYTLNPGSLNGNSITVNPVNTTTYTITATNSFGCTSSTTYLVTVRTVPIMTASALQTICLNQCATIVAGGALDYTWMPGGLIGATQIVCPLINTTYTVTGTNSVGCSKTKTVVVIVNPLPNIISSASATTVCSGTSVTSSAFGPPTIIWSSAISGPDTMASITQTLYNTTNYTITGVSAQGCISTTTLTILVNPLPTMTITALPNDTVCDGQQVTLTATGSDTYTWSNGITNGIPFTPIIGNTTYMVTGSNTTGCSNTSSITITVHPNPVVNITALPNDTVCDGEQVTLTATGSNSYSWNNGITNNVAFTPSLGNTIYIVTGTNATGCSATSSITITVHPNPILSIAALPNDTVCSGQQVALTATGSDVYVWNNGISNSVAFLPTLGNTSYVVTGTNATGCSATSSITITVHPNPALIISALPNDTVCNGQQVLLTATGSDAYSWDNGITNGVAFTPAIGNTTYIVSGTNATGCSGTSSITITVHPNPILSIAALPNDTVCDGQQVTLTATGSDTYSWTNGISNGVAFTPTLGNTTYTVTGINATGCSASSSITVTVHPNPVLIITALPNDTVCDGQQVTLTATGSDAYSWNNGIANGVAFTPTIGNTTYIVTGTNATGCNATNSINITVHPNPVLNIIALPNDTVCDGQQVTLTTTGANSYSWNNGIVNGVAFTPIIGNTTYIVTGTNTTGCSATSSTIITVHPNPTLSIAALPNDTVCDGQQVTLTATGSNTYSWTNGITNGVAFTPTLGNTIYTVTGTNSTGCSATSSITITVLPVYAIILNIVNDTICSGFSKTVIASGGNNSYYWDAPINAFGSTQIVSPATTTTYTVVGTNSYGCTNTATVNIVVKETPLLIANASVDTICAQDTVLLSASGANSYVWQPFGYNTANVSVVVNANNTYTCTGTSLNGCTSTVEVSFTINPLPIVSVTVQQSVICAGVVDLLTATGNAVNYLWLPDSLTGAVQSVTPTTTTVYTVQCLGVNGCANTSIITITVNPTPNVGCNNDTAICIGKQVLLAGTNADNYTWASSNASVVTNGIPFTPLTTATYTVTGYDATTGCSKTKTVTVIVNPLPNVQASNIIICAGQNATLSATGAPNLTWSNGIINGQSFSPTNTNNYTVTGIDNNGCVNYDTISVTVNPLPNVQAANVGICIGGQAVFNAVGAASLIWDNGIINNVPFTPTTSSPTLYTVLGTDANGCSKSATATLTVDSFLNVTASNQTVCTGEPITLLGNGAATYTWTGGVTNGVPFVPTSAGVYTVYGFSSGANNANVCTDSAIITLSLLPLPNVTAAGSDTTICINLQVALSGQGANTYTWSNGISDGVAFAPQATNTYTVTGTNANGCKNTATKKVSVSTGPQISADNVSGCINEKVELNGNSDGFYWWNDSANVKNNVKFLITGSQTYTLYAVDSTQCLDSLVVYLTAFTPPVITASPNIIVCAGQPVALSGFGGDFYAWDNNVIDGQSFIPLVTDTYIVFGYAINPNFCSDSASTIVTVVTTPTVTATPNLAICAGQDVTLSGSGATNYVWSGPGNITIQDNVPFIPTTSGVYTVIGLLSGPNGCTDTAYTTITIYTPPIVTASADTAICSGQQVKLIGTGASTYTWSGINAVSNNVAFVPPIGIDSYMVIGTAAAPNFCKDTAYTTVTVYASPNVQATADTVLCSGNQIKLVATGATIYSWDNNAINNNLFTPTVGVVNYTVIGTTFYAAKSCADTAKTRVEVYSTPNINASNDTALCNGGTIILSATGGNNISWFGTPSISNGVAFTPSVTTTYTAVAFANAPNFCKDTAIVTVTVGTTPTLTAVSNQVVCSGTPVILNTTGAPNITWSNNVVNNQSFIPNTAGIFTYTAIGSLGSGTTTCIDSVKMILTVYATPNISSTSDTAICSGKSVALTATSANSYIWLGSPLVTNGVSFTPTVTKTYTVVGFGIAPLFCSDTANTTVTVVATPTLTPVANQSVCSGTPVILNTTGATNITWSNNLVNNQSFTPTTAGIFTYTAIGSVQSGGAVCIDSVKSILTVAANPIVSATPDTSLCNGSSIVLNATGATTYTWLGTPTITNGSSIIPTATKTYTVVGFGISPLFCSDTANTTVTVVATPTLTPVANQSVCSETPVTFNTTGTPNITWSNSIVNNQSFTPTTAGVFTYTAIGSFQSGGTTCIDSVKTILTVAANPIVSATADTSLCNGNSMVLNATGATSFAWLGTPTVTNGSSITPATSKTYTVVGYGIAPLFCTDTANTIVTIMPKPTMIAAPNMAICSGQMITLNATASLGSMNWNKGVQNNVAFMPSVTDTFMAVAIAGNCSDTGRTIVNVNSLPIITAEPKDTNICATNSVKLKGKSATPNLTYSWTGGISNNTQFTPTATLDTFWVTGVDNSTLAGCSSTSYAVVKVITAPCAPFAINLLSFSGVANAGFTNTIQWKVADEQDVLEYQLERKTPNGEFKLHKIIYPNAANFNEYIYDDTQIDTINMYRLKAIENNSSFVYSQVITLNHVKSSSEAYLYPNPANENVNLVFTSKVNNSDLKIQILDVTGKVVKDQSEKVNIGTYTFPINISEFANGTYLLHYINDGDFSTGVVRFTKGRK